MNKSAAFRQGIVVALGLLILTIVEAYLALQFEYTALAGYFIISLFKAALVVQFFMHVSKLWREEDH